MRGCHDLSAGRTMPGTVRDWDWDPFGGPLEDRLSALPAPRSRHPEFNEPGWLRWRYERGDGDSVIAAELGVSPSTVARERHRQGIESRPAGRPRGARVVQPPDFCSAAMITARIVRESRPGGAAPTYDLLLGRFVAVDRARKAGNQHAEEDGLIELAAACGLLLDHLRRLRAA